ncbi:MAG: HDOD domain-containing protein [Candidatus Rokubacteria bacterium]|nr:HDOD domain-containing protein [Candidatus Rokubacteria bacterium]
MGSLTERFVQDIDGLSDLPSISPVLAQLVATLGREDASVADVSQIIREDPVIAARVLRAANSAAYAGRAPVTSIREALLRLGLARVRRLALVASLYAAVPVRGTRAARDAVWRHSLGVAHTAEILARHATIAPESADPESAFLAGLLHDIGLLVLESHYPRECAAARRHALAQQVPLPVAELAVLAVDHGELGALLATHWSLPPSITAAIRSHHKLEAVAPEYRWDVAIVHLADYLVSREGLGDLQEGSVAAFDASVYADLGLTPDAMCDIVTEASAEARRAAMVLAASIG